MEAEKKAKMDYDKDGKVESPKDEVWGSRLRAAKMAGKLKEEEQLDELSKGTLGSYVKKATTSVSANSFRSGYVKGSDTGHNLAVGKKGQQKDHSADSSSALGTARKRQAGIGKAVERLTREEVEQLQEYESKNGVFRHKAKLEKGVQYGETDWDKEEKEAKKMTSSPKRAQKGYGARQNFVRSTRVNEKKKVNEELSFTEMLELYNEHGLKVLAPIEKEEIEIEGNTIEVIDADKINGYVETVVEEADTEEFNKDLDTNKKKAAGTAKQPDLAKGDVQAVKNEEVEQMDEVAPPGREKQVKALKKVPGISNPWAVSWASYRKSHPKKKD